MKARHSVKRATGTSARLTAERGARNPAAGGKYAAIRRELQRQRAAILEEAGERLTKRDGQEAFPDVSDQASAEVDQNFTMRIKEREQKLLKKIDEALDRLKKNTYGICERCEEEIPYQRLKARPVTTLCIACKTQQEQEEKIHR
jgi:DnaK suppressor protein